ncbi:MarR family transcriptional regulator [Phenylobacterium sp.]|uniref:MarR family winged helix-turn-helix transcriptional regulator n=1 Tax=Phenylobacterium sp. TaxID=1871053 RepID=UPI001218C43B|nr:MarR family transcriptional regulator [Phenylobacterium sp.]THD56389.1 MAG: MarR family transcriptional regulator [Phenylobacterium sp.]
MPKTTLASIDPTEEFPFAVDDYLLHLVVAIYQFRDSRIDGALRALGLNVSRYRVLGVLERFGASTMTELSNFTAMQRTTLTRIADQLVAAGWVERHAEARDRRHVVLDLTDKGRETHAKALGLVLNLNHRLMDSVPEHERRSAARVLMQVVDNLAPNRLARDGIIHFSREGLGRDSAPT